MYRVLMDVAISEFRAALRRFVEQARAGEDVVLTERGLPVARLTAVKATPVLEKLEREGAITAARGARPRARGAARVRASGPVAALLDDLRR